MAENITLPTLPAAHEHVVELVKDHPNQPIRMLLEPYFNYEAQLRELYAQQPDHPVLQDPHVNAVPIFTGHEEGLKTEGRDLENETTAEKDSYMLPIPEYKRRDNGSMAVCDSLKTFKDQFNIFTEGSLAGLDWNNVVVAGSAAVTPLLPIPSKQASSKRQIRNWYHNSIAPASDVDLFLYDLTEEQAIEKIKQIELAVTDAILEETITVRTKNAITIISKHPIRHVQIVLRIYKSMSEVLTGFDVDCSCAAYDGSQVYLSPRALAAFVTQTNTIDLSRRSPSYENRLSKYSHRGFEVHWPPLDRSRIDPTIYERSFNRLTGLARLLVLEKVCHAGDIKRVHANVKLSCSCRTNIVGIVTLTKDGMCSNCLIFVEYALD